MTKRVLSQLVEELSTEMLTQFKEVVEFSEQGKLYVSIAPLIIGNYLFCTGLYRSVSTARDNEIIYH